MQFKVGDLVMFKNLSLTDCVNKVVFVVLETTDEAQYLYSAESTKRCSVWLTPSGMKYNWKIMKHDMVYLQLVSNKPLETLEDLEALYAV